MSAKRRAILLLISLLFSSALISCDLVSTILSKVTAARGATSTPIPPVVLEPTSTNTPTRQATPVSPLSLDGCAFTDNCPDAVKLRSIYNNDIQPNNKMFVSIPANTVLWVGVGWYTLDQAHMNLNQPNIVFYVKVDGNKYDVPLMADTGTFTDNNGNQYPLYTMGVAISGWEEGVSHTIEYGYDIKANINDGWDDFTPQTVNYIAIVTPTAAATETPTVTPTMTPKPIIYTPLPLVPTATQTPSCAVDSTITITNSSDYTINFFMTGPAKYNFQVTPGTNTINVCSGDYSYTGYGCGNGSQLNGEIHSGASIEFSCVAP